MTRCLASWVGRFVVASSILFAPQDAGPTEPPPPDDTTRLLEAQSRRLAGLAVAPDSSRAIAVVHTGQTHWLDYMNDVWRRVLVLVDLDGADPGVRHRLTDPVDDAHGPVWHPDGRSVVFFSRHDAATRLEAMDVDSGERRILARLEGTSANPAGRPATALITPDGRFAVYAVRPHAGWMQEYWGRLVRGPGTFGEAPIVIDDDDPFPAYKAQGILQSPRNPSPAQELWAVPLEGGVPVRLAADVPAGSQLAAVRWNGERGVVLVANAHRLQALPLPGADADAAATADLPGPPVLLQRLSDAAVALLRVGSERWQSVRLGFADGGPTFTTLAEGPAREGGEPRYMALSAAGDRLAVARFRGFQYANAVRRIATGEETILTPPGSSGRGHAAFLTDGTGLLLGEVTAVRPERLVHVGLDDGQRRDLGGWPGVPDLSGIAAPRVEEVRWSSDGVAIEGLLLLPDDSDAGLPYPLLLYLHGGPGWHVRHDFYYLAGGGDGPGAFHLARAGYAVLMPNFRGSLGYGDDFLRDLSDHRLYATPAADSLAGVEAMIERGVADPERLGVYGLSYGGMLTAWITGRDRRFKAAASGVAILDTLTSDRASGTGRHAFHTVNPLRKGPGDDPLDPWKRPEVYRDLSPLETAFEVRTPTLLISTPGEQNDLLGHAAYMNALRLNEVPVAWAYYPGAMHNGSWSLEEQRDFIDRLRAWFDRFL